METAVIVILGCLFLWGILKVICDQAKKDPICDECGKSNPDRLWTNYGTPDRPLWRCPSCELEDGHYCGGPDD